MFGFFILFNNISCVLELRPPTAKELGLLCGSLKFLHELQVTKKSASKKGGDGVDDVEKHINSYDYCLYGLRCSDANDIATAQKMKLALEGYIRAALFHGIFFIYSSDHAKQSISIFPGAVQCTHQQFKVDEDEMDPNCPIVPTGTITTYNRVRHVRLCFMLSLVLLNGTSTLPHQIEKTAYGYDGKKGRKKSTNERANETKRMNYELLAKKVSYNMKLLHKASLAGTVFSVLFVSFFVFLCNASFIC